MFDLPEAKRVRREELEASDCSSEPDVERDADLRARLEAQLAQTLGLDLVEPQSHTLPPARPESGTGKQDSQSGNGGPLELEFCLFGGAKPTKVVLEDEVESEGEGGLVPTRPYSYFFPGKPSRRLQAEYDFAAMSGRDVLELSRRRFWGMEHPWRVTHAGITTRKGPSAGGSEEGTSDGKREKKKTTKPGKKQRIALRVQARAKAAEDEAAAKQAAEKEEQVKDKKKRMNRLKKLRKRAKEKEKKLASTEGGGHPDDASDSEST